MTCEEFNKLGSFFLTKKDHPNDLCGKITPNVSSGWADAFNSASNVLETDFPPDGIPLNLSEYQKLQRRFSRAQHNAPYEFSPQRERGWEAAFLTIKSKLSREFKPVR